MGDENQTVDQAQLMRKALAECIAVFIFVFSGCLCAASDPKEIFAIAMAVRFQPSSGPPWTFYTSSLRFFHNAIPIVC